MYSRSILPVLALFLLTPLAVAAQFNSIGTAPFTLDVSPQYPGPYDTVSITPQSSAFDVISATFTLYVNGTQIASESGGEPFTVPMRGPGVPLSVRVVAASGGKSYEAEATLVPTAVALVVEPISTVPPLYEGSPLLASEGRARIVALADFRTGTGARLDPTKLVYTWHLGDQLLEEESGIGRSTLALNGPVAGRDAKVSVLVATSDGSEVGSRSVDLSPEQPVLRIYRDDPLLGPLFNTALQSGYAMSGAEDTLIAVPYYFSIQPTFDWSVGGSDAGTDPVVTLRTTGAGSGSAAVSVIATGSTFESAEADTQVSFSSGQAQTNAFGL